MSHSCWVLVTVLALLLLASSGPWILYVLAVILLWSMWSDYRRTGQVPEVLRRLRRFLCGDEPDDGEENPPR